MKLSFLKAEPSLDSFHTEKLWRSIEADIQEHHSRLAGEFQHRFRGNLARSTFLQVEAKQARLERGFPPKDTKDSILLGDAIIASEFIPEKNIRSLFLKGILDVRSHRGTEWAYGSDQAKAGLTAARREHEFTIQIIPGTSAEQKKRKYLALVQVSGNYDSYVTSRYLSSLGDLINDGGKTLSSLIEEGIAKIQGKN